MQRVHYGPPSIKTPLKGLDIREFAMMLSIVALLIWLGVYPQPLLDTTEATMNEVYRLFEPSDTAITLTQEAR